MKGLRPAPEVVRLRPYTVPAARRRGLLRLDFNENLAGPSPRVLERLRRLDPDDIATYPDETAARTAVARWFGLEEGCDLVLTAGVDEGIRLVCDVFVRRGEKVVLVEPCYPLYRFYATLAGAEIVTVSCGKDLSFPEAELRERLSRDRAGRRLLIVGDPNNPTGSPAPAGLIEELAAAHPATIVLADEAYAEFSGRSSIPALGRLPNLVVARTFSKAHGLAGLRAGVLLGDRATLSWLARVRSPYAVNAVALLALEAALADDSWVARCVEEVRTARERLAEGLRALGVPSYPSAANFLLARFGKDARRIQEAMRRQGVLVRDRGDHPLLRGTLRIGIGTRSEAGTCLAVVAAALAAGDAVR